MNTAEWFSELSREMQLPYYDRDIFGPGAGALIGTRDGYLIMVGLAKSDKVRVVLRHGKADPDLVKQAVNMELGEFQGPIQEAGTIVVDHEYSFGDPTPSEIAEAVRPIFTALKSVAPPLNGRCETCQRDERRITLFNRLPGYHCPSCQHEIAQKQNATAGEYAPRDAHLPRGILYGVVAALASSLNYGFLGYGDLGDASLAVWILIRSNVGLTNGTYLLLLAFGTGVVVATAVIQGIGKVDWPGRISIGVLTLAGIRFGYVIFETCFTMRHWNLSFNLSLPTNLWNLDTNDILCLLFGLIGAGVVMYRSRRPEFNAQFEPLG